MRKFSELTNNVEETIIIESDEIKISNLVDNTIFIEHEGEPQSNSSLTIEGMENLKSDLIVLYNENKKLVDIQIKESYKIFDNQNYIDFSYVDDLIDAFKSSNQK